jgi:hypothetical protein
MPTTLQTNVTAQQATDGPTIWPTNSPTFRPALKATYLPTVANSESSTIGTAQQTTYWTTLKTADKTAHRPTQSPTNKSTYWTTQHAAQLLSHLAHLHTVFSAIKAHFNTDPRAHTETLVPTHSARVFLVHIYDNSTDVAATHKHHKERNYSVSDQDLAAATGCSSIYSV